MDTKNVTIPLQNMMNNIHHINSFLDILTKFENLQLLPFSCSFTCVVKLL